MPEEALTLDPRKSALLVMDYQQGILQRIPDTEVEDLLQRTAGLLAAARGAGLRVLYVVVGFRAGYPEGSPNNLSFGAIKAAGRFLPDDPGARIHPAVAPAEGEVIVTKHRVGAFLGTDLDMILRAHGIDTLVLAGVATGGVVLSTLRYAADADYRCVVIKDGCADADAEIHEVLTGKVFPRQATVASAERLLAALENLRRNPEM
jgi:nicotinamidase-related amidase